MWTDPIVEETRSIRTSIASSFDYDIVALGEYFKSKNATTVSAALAKVRLRKTQSKKQITETLTEQQTPITAKIA